MCSQTNNAFLPFPTLKSSHDAMQRNNYSEVERTITTV